MIHTHTNTRRAIFTVINQRTYSGVHDYCNGLLIYRPSTDRRFTGLGWL